MIGQVVKPGIPFEVDDDATIHFPQPGLLIAETCLNDKADAGKGFGKALYLKALQQYGVLYSTFPISTDAFRVHDSLVRSGIAQREVIEGDVYLSALRLRS